MRPFYESKNCDIQSYESFELEFPEHLHDHAEILLVLSGSIVVKIMERCQELRAGDCAIIFPQQIHSYKPAESRTRLYIFDDSLTGMYLHSIRRYIPTQPFLSAETLSGDGRLILDRIYSLSCADRESAGVPSEESAAVCGALPSRTAELCSAWIQVLFALIWPQLAPEKWNRSE